MQAYGSGTEAGSRETGAGSWKVGSAPQGRGGVGGLEGSTEWVGNVKWKYVEIGGTTKKKLKS